MAKGCEVKFPPTDDETLSHKGIGAMRHATPLHAMRNQGGPHTVQPH